MSRKALTDAEVRARLAMRVERLSACIPLMRIATVLFVVLFLVAFFIGDLRNAIAFLFVAIVNFSAITEHNRNALFLRLLPPPEEERRDMNSE